MEYTAVIRTLGKSGIYFQTTLNSLLEQTIPPTSIIVYIAEGYPLPKETVGIEQYVYVKKGMVSQRALQYKEVTTEYILFLDDDVFLPPTSVETLYYELINNKAEVISPCVFPNHLVSPLSKLRLSLLGREFCRLWGKRWGYKILWNGGFSYKNNPKNPVYESQTNAGPCFFCRKNDFLKIHFEDEVWLEQTPYAFPDDQVMYYKMYNMGLKIITSFDSGIIHLDASSTISDTKEKAMKVVYSEYRNKLIFWHRFLYKPTKSILIRCGMILALSYTYGIQAFKYVCFFLNGQKAISRAFWKGFTDGINFIKSNNYRCIPPIIKQK